MGQDRNKTEFGIRSVHLLDANQDGSMDIALAGSVAQKVVVLMNTRIGGASLPTFTRESYSFSKGRLTSADFNLDGKPDLAVTLWDENRVALLLHR